MSGMPTADCGTVRDAALPPAIQHERRTSPLLGLWALLVAATLTFAGAKINLAFVHVLYDSARPADLPPSNPRAGMVENT
jgi:hypothetical protein